MKGKKEGKREKRMKEEEKGRKKSAKEKESPSCSSWDNEQWATLPLDLYFNTLAPGPEGTSHNEARFTPVVQTQVSESVFGRTKREAVLEATAGVMSPFVLAVN